jgi:hypothetical protein
MVEQGMRNDATTRRSPLQDLFAERQEHIRNGGESHYVVLSRPLQIGVAAGCLAALVLLAFATYNAVTKHLALTQQDQAVAALTASLAEMRQSAGGLEGASEIERLNAALADAQAEHDATAAAEAQAQARIAELEEALASASTQGRQLTTALEGARAATRAETAAQESRVQAMVAEVTGLRAEIDRLNREAQALRTVASQARQALEQLQTADAVPTDTTAAAADLATLKQDSAVNLRADQPGEAVAVPASIAVASDTAGSDPPLPSPPAPR